MSCISILNNKVREYLTKVQELDKDKFTKRAIPLVTGTSYLLHSTKFTAPNFFSKLCGDNSISISKTLFINSLVGSVFYIFTSKHMKNTNLRYAIGFSAFESVMFNLGSVLAWSLTKVYLPDNEFLNIWFGFFSGIFLLFTAKSYLHFLDNTKSFSNIMKGNIEIVETTFGQIKIYKDKPEEVEQKFSKLNERCVEKLDETNSSDNENFFGLEQDNFFDQKMVDEYKLNKEISKSAKTSDEKLPIAGNEIEKKDLNFIDDIYFGNLSKNNGLESPMEKSQTFIQEKNDESFGNIRSLIQNKKDLDQNQNYVPIITSKNQAIDEKKKLPTLKSTTIEKPKIDSNHKILKEEVLNWEKMTLDESAEILKNHICYHNEEEGIFAIDKPYGLASIKGPGLHLSVSKILPILEKILKLDYRLLMCNRLDEFTTGVMLFATNNESARKIRNCFDQKKIIKQYLAITKNVPKMSTGEINIPLLRRSINSITRTYLSPNYDEETKFVLKNVSKENEMRKEAITKYRVIDSNKNSALIEVQPKTGYQHQIRAHLAYGLGCPILGDHKYSHHIKLAPQKLSDEVLKALKIKQSKARYVPMHLHANQIILEEFSKTKNIFIRAKLPLHFINNLKRLKLKF